MVSATAVVRSEVASEASEEDPSVEAEPEADSKATLMILFQGLSRGLLSASRKPLEVLEGIFRKYPAGASEVRPG